MKITQENINMMLERYIMFVNEISEKNNYENNIRHLLYIIIPAFILKYGPEQENTILKSFREVKIHISKKEDNVVTAYFIRTPKKIMEEGKKKFYTEKNIVLNEYKTASLTNLFDNIIHEFNHAVNSINNEISYDDKVLKLRTGISYLIYDKSTLKFIKKSDDSILEEIINTAQTEEIMDIINSFGNYKITNDEFNNALYSLKNEIGKKYQSKAYYLQSYVCKELIKNKTFINTIATLRFKGFIEDIPRWFNDIVGKDNSYENMVGLLNEIFELEKSYAKSKFFKNYKLNKIKEKISVVLRIADDFTNKCIFK